MPAGTTALVTQTGSSPNFTNTVTFINLASDPGPITVVNSTNTVTPGSVFFGDGIVQRLIGDAHEQG
jgi:hypothetical protein